MNTNIEYMATHKVEDIKEYLNINLSGLTEDEVDESRDKYGSNKVKKEKKDWLRHL